MTTGGARMASSGRAKLPALHRAGRAGQATASSKVTLANYATGVQPSYESMIEADYDVVIETGNDVIEYYAHYGHNAKVKIFFLNRAFPSTEGAFYDLVVVPKSQCHQEYFTITAAGVVHVPGDGTDPDMITVNDWLREQSIYNLMRQMRFFKYYFHQRFLSRWCNTTHRIRFNRVRQQFYARSFLAKPQMCDAIVFARQHINNMQTTSALALEEDRTYQLDEFKSEQETHIEQKMAHHLETMSYHLRSGLVRFITTVTKAEEQVRAEVQEFERDPSGGAVAGKSIVKVKLQYMERLQHHRGLKMEVEMLPSLVRLIDFMAVTALSELVSSGMTTLHEATVARGLISSSVSLGPDGVREFSPDLEAVRGSLADGEMSLLSKMAMAVPRIIEMPPFLPVFQKQLGRKAIAPDLKQIISTKRSTNVTCQKIETLAETSFVEAREKTASLEDLRPIMAFGESWDPVAYEAQEMALPQFRKDMMLMVAWQKQLAALPEVMRFGLLSVSTGKLREKLGSGVSSALDTMRSMLSVAARAECARVLLKFQNAHKSLQGRPTDLHGYAAFLETLTKLQVGKDEFAADAKLVDDMYEMLVEYDAKVNENDKLVVDDLKDAITSLGKSMEESAAFCDEYKQQQVEALDEDVKLLFTQLQSMVQTLRSGDFDDRDREAGEVVKVCTNLATQMEGMRDLSSKFALYQELMQLDAVDFTPVQAAGRELKWHQEKWTALHQFEDLVHGWTTCQTNTLEPEEVETKMDEIAKANYKMIKQRRDDLVCVRLKEELESFKDNLPLLALAADKALRERHWEQIYGLLEAEFVPGETVISVSGLQAAGVMDKYEGVETIVAAAVKENNILKNLDKMETEWEGQDFRTVPFKTESTILGGTDDIQTILDDQIVKIQAMNAQPFMKPFADRGKTWETTLARLQEILDNWLKVQSVWMYLEPIFSSEDIVKQMPEEGSKFQQVDTTWKTLMDATVKKPAAIPIAQQPAILTKLLETNELLDEIQKGLAAYLEKKRLFFPRFFFLSNDDMLEILSETKDPTRVQPHLRKCFEAIDALTFDPNLKILQMVSVEGEKVDFVSPVDTVRARGAVERWLVEVEEAMVTSVHDVVRRGMEAYPTKPRNVWVLEWPGAVVLVVTAMFWTQGVIGALQTVAESGDGKALAKYEEECTNDLLRIVDLVRGELTGLQRATLGALVVMDVHARDVCTAMVTKGVNNEADFEWQAQLRTYWQEDKEGNKGMTVMMEMMSAEVEYGYEYLGNSSRLVITPLTDRCYRTLMGAIHLTMGGAPEGPAGTGKTETTKDLAKALARQCVVFNCSDQLDYLAMGKFFKGLASSGAWACFDEFNRINLEVLSVVAQQVLDIQRAITARLTEFDFEGTHLRLKWTAWCAITMNPGYAGRSELPDNLKALFRTVAMMVPDYAMISEIILFSFGYLQARESAKKIVQCYKLCSEQLSSQDHYDYGMRAVVAVLRAAGNLKRRYPEEDEYVLMLRSIIDVNLCKFLSDDVPLFHGIVSDLFPGVVLPEPDYGHMIGAMKEVCVKENLQPTEYFFLKTTQLYEMIVVRHGLMIVGLPFSGKTSSYKVLAQALTLMKERGQDKQDDVEFHVVNPKSVTMGQLYGQFDPASHEWSDGVLAVKFRQCATDRTTKRKWLILDGPVDAIWIENMNTVLDDNKKLCLNSGEIIQMSTNHSMIFEVMDLAVASPATVSRCGMVYLEPHQLGWRPLVDSWMNTFPVHFDDELKTHIRALFEWLVPVCLRFLRREIKEISPTLDANLVTTLMRLTSSLLSHFGCGQKGADDAAAAVAAALDDAETAGNDPDEVDQADAAIPQVWKDFDSTQRLLHVESAFLFALVWSIGCTGATSATRVMFDEFLRHALAGTLDQYQGPSGEVYTTPLDIPEDHVTFKQATVMADTDGATVFDYFFDLESSEWRTWTAVMDTSPIPTSSQYRTIIVPTVDTVRYTYLMQKNIEARLPMLLVGETGTGKSVYLNRYIKSLPTDTYAPPINVNFSARTSANMTQYMIDGRLDRRPPKRLGLFGPAGNKRGVILVDDLNMPTKEEYGAQPPIELLRQWMDHSGWYDRDNTFRTIKDVLFVCAMGPPGGGRTFVTPRYLRHFNMVSITEFDDRTLKRIFTSILDWYMTKESLPESMSDLKQPLVAATIEVYKQVMGNLLPTPTKSHYTFNLRDISRVMQGLILAKKRIFVEEKPTGQKEKMIRLWFHEVLRVFGDRLVDNKDREWFLEYLKTTVTSAFDVVFEKVFRQLIGKGDLDLEATRRCFFGDFLDQEAEEPVDRTYDELTDVHAINEGIEEFLVDHNASSKRPMNLAIFLYACEHVSRISRVLKQAGAHILNVGVGGSGRQSLSRLAGFMMGMEVFQIEISKSYGVADWREDLKRFTRRAGADGVPCVFLFSDTQVKYDSFIEDINNLLNAGEVPNMFPYDERSAIRETCRVQAKKKAGLDLDTEEEQWTWFIDKTKENLHIVLCMSPVGDAFRDRLRQFPSLVNCCTINWFQQWPNDALEAVAAKFLAEVEMSDKERSDITEMCKTFHNDIRILSDEFLAKAGRFNYVTPTSYLELITMFKTVLATQRDVVSKAKRRYEVGLEKLSFAAEQVSTMQAELEDLIPVLTVTVADTEKLMAQVTKEKTEVVEPKKAIVDVEVAKASESAAAANAIKEECEAALAEAIPALDAATAALNTIKPADIKLVASFANPPKAVKTVMEAVCVMLDEAPVKVPDPNGGPKKILDYWPTAKTKLLNDPKLLNRLLDYDKDNIDAKIMAKVRNEYIADEEFTVANAAKAASAAAGMCKWIFAMSDYDRVVKIVGPKKEELAIAEAAYAEVKAALDLKQAELKEVLDKLAAAEQQLEESMAKKLKLESEVELCKAKLERAAQLINGLGGEKDRWTEAAHKLGDQYTNLTGDMIISAGVIGYLGAFTMTYREKAIHQWVKLCKTMGVPSSSKFSLTEALGDPVKIREWTIFGLPNDSFSIDNGIVMANARRWPLLIDPQGQANKWIKEMEKADVRVIKLSDSDYLRTLENAIQFGLPVLLENVMEELDPSLEPLLLKNIFKVGGTNYIQLGDTQIEYSKDFRFYMTTAMRNPHYLPEIAVKVTLLNFMITQEGLSDQMLGVVVAEERPDLEEQRSELVIQSAENKKKLKEIEDKILHVLSSSEGNILEDEGAINTLNTAKVVSNDIEEKQKVADETNIEIERVRALYAPCGAFNSVLFFCIADLAGIDPMYQYSLAWFINLFVRSIRNSEKVETTDDDVSNRLDVINNHFTYSLYQNICRSLFEKDKLLFAFLLGVRIELSQHRLTGPEYMFLLTGGVGVDPQEGTDRPDEAGAPWITDKIWGELTRLGGLSAAMPKNAVGKEAMGTLVGHLATNVTAWREVYDNVEPHAATLPGDYATTLTPFQRLLVLRCLRPDKLVPAVSNYVAASQGQKYIEPPLFDLAGSYEESSCTVPLLFVLSTGSDPTAALLKFADDRGFGSRIDIISMGQGQGPKAAKLIHEGRNAGRWVLLQNCHLAPSWMTDLEKITEGITKDNTDNEFRLWMMSMPSPAFPISILQNGVKMTMEPPAGLRANMRRSLLLDPLSSDSFFEGCSKPAEFKRLLFGLVFMHAFVQERRKYGPIGWNIPYGFDDGDLRISARQLRMYLDGNADVPFDALRYAIGECNYGGRVTDDKDRRLLATLLSLMIRPDALDATFSFSASGTYKYPAAESEEAATTLTHADFVEQVATFPLIALPEAFGLHDNADITKDLQVTSARLC